MSGVRVDLYCIYKWRHKLRVYTQIESLYTNWEQSKCHAKVMSGGHPFDYWSLIHE